MTGQEWRHAGTQERPGRGATCLVGTPLQRVCVGPRWELALPPTCPPGRAALQNLWLLFMSLRNCWPGCPTPVNRRGSSRPLHGPLRVHLGKYIFDRRRPRPQAQSDLRCAEGSRSPFLWSCWRLLFRFVCWEVHTFQPEGSPSSRRLFSKYGNEATLTDHVPAHHSSERRLSFVPLPFRV